MRDTAYNAPDLLEPFNDTESNLICSDKIFVPGYECLAVSHEQPTALENDTQLMGHIKRLSFNLLSGELKYIQHSIVSFSSPHVFQCLSIIFVVHLFSQAVPQVIPVLVQQPMNYPVSLSALHCIRALRAPPKVASSTNRLPVWLLSREFLAGLGATLFYTVTDTEC